MTRVSKLLQLEEIFLFVKKYFCFVLPHQAPLVQQHVRGVGLRVEADQVQGLVNVDQLSICCVHSSFVIVWSCEALLIESSA